MQPNSDYEGLEVLQIVTVGYLDLVQVVRRSVSGAGSVHLGWTSFGFAVFIYVSFWGRSVRSLRSMYLPMVPYTLLEGSQILMTSTVTRRATVDE